MPFAKKAQSTSGNVFSLTGTPTDLPNAQPYLNHYTYKRINIILCQLHINFPTVSTQQHPQEPAVPSISQDLVR